MEPKIVQREAFAVAGLELRCRMGEPDAIPQLWQRSFAHMNEIQGLTEPGISYGVMYNYDEATEAWDYLAGYAVDADAPLPEGMTRKEIPAQRYAVFTCTMPTIQETYDAIYQEWLPQSGYEHAPTPEFERYGQSFNPNDPTSQFEIFVPLQEKE